MCKRLITLITVLLFIGCQEAPEFGSSVFDAGEQIPETELLQTATLFNDPMVEMWWHGNDFAFSYSYKLELLNYPILVNQSYFDWSAWSSDTSVTFDKLDEGNYIFSIKSHFSDEIEEAIPQSLNFEVNAISGPALRIYPLKQEVDVGSTVNVYLFAEEIDAVAGLEIELNFDPNVITYNNNVDGSLLSDYTAGGDFTIFPPLEAGNNTMLISGAVSGNGLSGTGAIAKLIFTYSGSAINTEISISNNTLFKDASNASITIQDQVSGLIEVSQ